MEENRMDNEIPMPWVKFREDWDYSDYREEFQRHLIFSGAWPINAAAHFDHVKLEWAFKRGMTKNEAYRFVFRHALEQEPKKS